MFRHWFQLSHRPGDVAAIHLWLTQRLWWKLEAPELESGCSGHPHAGNGGWLWEVEQGDACCSDQCEGYIDIPWEYTWYNVLQIYLIYLVTDQLQTRRLFTFRQTKKKTCCTATHGDMGIPEIHQNGHPLKLGASTCIFNSHDSGKA